jgi:hypothetical protein
MDAIIGSLPSQINVLVFVCAQRTNEGLHARDANQIFHSVEAVCAHEACEPR